MLLSEFEPFHLNATPDDLAGNDGIGRYILLPSSSARAHDIAKHFERVTVKHHPREHNLYFGTLKINNQKIDVATVHTGMGCASTEIILHELFNLGAKRFLRVGTASTLQPNYVKVGSLVNVQASVRDEGTTTHYAPIEVPAIASLEFITAILVAAEKLDFANDIHTGVAHCKATLYARQEVPGPRSLENQAYLQQIIHSGVLATEMETAALFIQSQIYNHQLIQQGGHPQHRVLCGAILSIISEIGNFRETPLASKVIDDSIQLALETIKIIASQELQF